MPFQPEMMTPRQRGYIAALHTQLGIAHVSGRQLTKEEASAEIGALLQLKAQQQRGVPRELANARVVAPAVSEVGMYRSADGAIYKVQRAAGGTGGLYAKKLVPISGQRMSEINDVVAWHFVYDRGAIRSLNASHKLTLDQAREFGIRYGVCCVCSATLTDATSVANGIGPVCARRLGAPRQAVRTDRHAPETVQAAMVAEALDRQGAALEARRTPADVSDTNQEELELEMQLRMSLDAGKRK
jgi:hypothetical protein